jgi:hypothetical protein
VLLAVVNDEERISPSLFGINRDHRIELEDHALPDSQTGDIALNRRSGDVGVSPDIEIFSGRYRGEIRPRPA